MKFDFIGKTVVITGGTSGIGKAVAAAFLKEGCYVAVCGRNPAKVDAVTETFDNERFFAMVADATSVDQTNQFGDCIFERFGRVDVWINNAGLSDPMPFERADETAFDRMVSANLKSAFFGSQTAARLMKKSRDVAENGVIINTSSFTSVIPTAGKALYGATKAAVTNLTRTLAAELAADRIRVVSIVPGYISTEMTEKNIAKNRDWLVSNIAERRLGNPEDMVGAYVFLASDAAAYVTGTELIVSGGKLCVQNPLWSWEAHS